MKNDDIIRSIICLFAMDGQISKEEIEFLKGLRKKLGVSQKVVKTILDEARTGKGRVQLSDDPKEMTQMFEMLVRAAVADGKVDPQERKILNAVAAKIGISEKDVERVIKARLRQALAAKPKPTGSKRKEPQSMNCPKCGFTQKAGRVECIRCGIIFKRVTPEESEPEEEIDEPLEELRSKPISWLRDNEEKERELEQEQQHIREEAAKMNKRLAIAGSVVVLTLSILVFWFGGVSGLLAYMTDVRERKALSSVTFQLTSQSLQNLKQERVPDEILDSLEHLLNQPYENQGAFSHAVEHQITSLLGSALWHEYRDTILQHTAVSNPEYDAVRLAQARLLSGSCTSKRRGRYSRGYRCYVTYTFRAVLSGGGQKTISKKKELVSPEWYNQQQLSQPVPVFYLADDPAVSRTMGRGYRYSRDLYNGLLFFIGGLVGSIGSIVMLIRNTRREFSPYEKSNIKVTTDTHRGRTRIRFR